MQCAKRHFIAGRAAFTLIELLTVVAIMAVLASLLLTALASAKKKSRAAVCTSNLHQFTLALDLFMDDSGGKRPALDELVAGHYLPSTNCLLCPEDKTGNWGQLVQMHGILFIPSSPQTGSVNFSHLLYPLNWSDAEWERLMGAGGRAGVAACQLHGLGTQDAPDIRNYSGLLLRAQRDGSILRRQFFWSPLLQTNPGSGTTIPTGTGSSGLSSLYPLQIYFDDPANWQDYR